jgi:hypothetical protein
LQNGTFETGKYMHTTFSSNSSTLAIVFTGPKLSLFAKREKLAIKTNVYQGSAKALAIPQQLREFFPRVGGPAGPG